MNLLKYFKDFLNANRLPSPHAPPWPSSSPTTQSKSRQVADPKGAGHVESKRISFVQVGPNDTIAKSDEQWLRKGNIMEGVTHEVRVITGSGDIVEPSKLKTICSQCHKAESIEIRSSISNLPLCRTCQRILTMPDGTEKILTPAEYANELNQYDTWAALDNNRKRRQ